MPHSPSSPFRPVRVVENGKERRAGRCFPCERYLGTEPVMGDHVHLDAAAEIAGVTLAPGWYCRRCIERAKRAD